MFQIVLLALIVMICTATLVCDTHTHMLNVCYLGVEGWVLLCMYAGLGSFCFKCFLDPVSHYRL